MELENQLSRLSYKRTTNIERTKSCSSLNMLIMFFKQMMKLSLNIFLFRKEPPNIHEKGSQKTHRCIHDDCMYTYVHTLFIAKMICTLKHILLHRKLITETINFLVNYN